MAKKKSGAVGSAGRFGARYGRVARRRVKEIEADTHAASVDGDDVTRVGTGVWRNEETGELFTGGAYRPQTPGGRQVRRSIRAALSEGEATDVDAEDA
ncbi:MAG: 50S ribosomal protein L37ae [Haloferacaceae archaeon]